MKTLSQQLNIQPGDVLIAPKSSLNILKHMIVYWGVDANGDDFYLENSPQAGVQWLTEQSLRQQYEIITVRKFCGTPHERTQAISRAESVIGQKYDLTTFNCEHYANYVQTGASFSKQASNGIGVGLAALGLMVVASSLAKG